MPKTALRLVGVGITEPDSRDAGLSSVRGQGRRREAPSSAEGHAQHHTTTSRRKNGGGVVCTLLFGDTAVCACPESSEISWLLG